MLISLVYLFCVFEMKDNDAFTCWQIESGMTTSAFYVSCMFSS